MESHRTCLFVRGLFHLVGCLQSSTMLSCVGISFFFKPEYPLDAYTTFCLPVHRSRDTSCFRVLAMVEKAAIHKHVQVSLRDPAFGRSFGSISRSRIATHTVIPFLIFFFEEPPNRLPKWPVPFYMCPKSAERFEIFPHLCRHLLFSVTVHLVGVK